MLSTFLIATAAEAEPHVNWFGWAERHEFPPLGFAIINFVVLLFLLRKLAWPKIRDGARLRHEEIVRRLAQSKQAQAAAQARLQETNRRLGAIDEEIGAIVEGVRGEAEAEKARMIAAALATAERLHRDTAFTISQEGKQLRIDLQRELAVQVTAQAEQLLRKHLDVATNRVICDEFVESIVGAGK